MTKTQIKAKASKMLEDLWRLCGELDDLRLEVEEERDSVEPYDGKNDLTPTQEDRVEWLDNLAYALQQLIYAYEENTEEVFKQLEQ